MKSRMLSLAASAVVLLAPLAHADGAGAATASAPSGAYHVHNGRVVSAPAPKRVPGIANELAAAAGSISVSDAADRTAADALAALGAPVVMRSSVSTGTGTPPNDGIAHNFDVGVPAGDLNGDGVTDVLLGQFTAYPAFVVAFDGATGDTLWEHASPDFFLAAIPATLAGGERGAISVSVQRTYLPGSSIEAARRITLEGLGHDGAVRWTRVVAGAGVAPTAGFTLPWVSGVLDANGDGATDVLVALETYATVANAAVAHTSAVVVSGADGSTVSVPAYTSEGRAESSVQAMPDLSGDGKADVLLVSGQRMVAARGTDGAVLWSVGAGIAPGTAVAMGDMTGDGITDVAGWAPYAPGSGATAPGAQVVVSGCSGRQLWRVDAAGPAAPIGDVDGDGRADAGTESAIVEPTRLGVQYTVRSSAGTVVYQQDYTVAAPAGDYDAYIVLRPVAGDLDADSIRDWGHGVVTLPAAGLPAIEQGAVSGATGAKLWDGNLDLVLGASVDGSGDDYLTGGATGAAVRDGATNALVWESTAPLRTNVQAAAADLDHDGRAEVIVRDMDPATDLWAMRVLDGADGHEWWTVAA